MEKVKELKAQAYDLLALIEQAQAQLREINGHIQQEVQRATNEKAQEKLKGR